MLIRSDPVGSPENLNRMINEASNCREVSGLMVLACDSNGFTPENLDDILRNAPAPIFGGIFPSLIHGEELMQQGSLVVGLSKVIQTRFIPELSNPSIDYESFLDCGASDLESAHSVMVFVDGFAKRIGAFIETLFNVFGLEINYIGGGAGSLNMSPMPCLLTNEGLMADGAVLALTELNSGVGVSHGWTSLSAPLRVTQSDGNTIFTLNWEPALDVYRGIVESHSGKTFGTGQFIDISKSYPFGISRFESEHVVRDPFQTGPDNSLVCVGEVPEGSFVSVLHGDGSSVIKAAAKARDLALSAFPPQCEAGLCVFIDCISRVLFLEDRFAEELRSVRCDSQPLVGACTIGEIANCGTELLEFYNKTAVVAVLEAG